MQASGTGIKEVHVRDLPPEVISRVVSQWPTARIDLQTWPEDGRIRVMLPVTAGGEVTDEQIERALELIVMAGGVTPATDKVKPAEVRQRAAA